MAYVVKCESCGNKLLTYEVYERKYGSPVKACKKCGREYIDPRFKELAITGIPEKEFSIPACIFMIIIGLLISWRGIYLFGMRQLNVSSELQWVMPVIILILGIVFVIGGIIEMIRVATGSKLKKYERLMDESIKRMKNTEYAIKLASLGYSVPDKYIKEDEN